MATETQKHEILVTQQLNFIKLNDLIPYDKLINYSKKAYEN